MLLLSTLFFFLSSLSFSFLFFFNDTATTEIYTLSLHDALPISCPRAAPRRLSPVADRFPPDRMLRLAALLPARRRDRKSTRLNSSHEWISYAVFCLKKKKKKTNTDIRKNNTAPQVKLTTNVWFA